MSTAFEIFSGSAVVGRVCAQVTGGPGPLDFVTGHLGAVIALLILVVGVAMGLPDLLRLSPKRVWAISSVGFRESVRRRVLWITPLAMLGIVAVTQLSHPFDEQDAVRQATKYCLFATGIVVVIAVIVLACTNLPREIDNRVIYTIVTKPTTRLEIVLGKTLGFARTSGLILVIMGVFSYGYLTVNAAQLRSAAEARYRNLPQGDLSRDTLRHYVEEGLLKVREYDQPADLQMYARLPEAGDAYTWLFGNKEQSVVVPFEVPDRFFDREREDGQLIISLEIATRQRELTAAERETEQPEAPATTRPATAPGGSSAAGAATQPARRMPPRPAVQVQVVDDAGFTAAAPGDLVDLMHLDPRAEPGSQRPPKNAEVVLLEPRGPAPGAREKDAQLGTAVIVVPPKPIYEKLRRLPSRDGKRQMAVQVTGLTAATRYGYAGGSVRIRIPPDVPPGAGGGGPEELITLGPRGSDGKPLPPGAPAAPPQYHFTARTMQGSNAQQLRGDADPAEAPVAVYAFRGAELPAAAGGDVPFEFRTRIERSGAEVGEAENATEVQVVVRNAKTGALSAPVVVRPETGRPTYFRLPADAVAGGDFDVQMRTLTPGHYVGLGMRRTDSLRAIAAERSFLYNLVKSLFILWLLSVLVVVISIFCSTFVSWPIAIVLTLVLLLGRWCVTQIGDQATPQQMLTDFFGPKAGAVEAELFTGTVSVLNKGLQVLAAVLPDTDRFRVTEDIEAGISIPHASILDALKVLGTFGVPLLVLSYIFLKRKEVAP